MTPNPNNWFSKRELKIPPFHFVKTSVPVTPESYMWVLARLSGRFSTSVVIEDSSDDFASFLINTDNIYLFFEDPADAMMYELRWAGSK